MIDNKNTSISSNSDFAVSIFTNILFDKLTVLYTPNYTDLVILCIGTDKSTGDSLGPLVGYFLEKRLISKNKNVHLYGTLDKPVHAKNLNDHIELINYTFINPFIIAVDASLGLYQRVGFVTVWDGPLKPGAGVNKKLPEIGNIHITGVVNIAGFMEIILLQNTRLNTVMKMANIISSSIIYSINKLNMHKQNIN